MDLLGRLTDVSRPRVVGAISIAHGANEFITIAIPPIIPLLVTDLGISYAQSGLLVTVFFAMYVVFQIPAGVVGDWVGKRLMLVSGLICMGGGVFLASVAWNFEILLLAQAVSGLGGSTFHPLGMGLISDVESNVTEGKAMGIFGFGGVIGTMAAPIVVGGLAILGGWRVGLVGATILCLVATAIFYRSFSEEGDDTVSTDSRSTRTVTDRFHSFRTGFLPQMIEIARTPGVLVLFAITLVVGLQMRAIHTFTTAYVVEETGMELAVGNFSFFVLLAGASISSLWAGALADRYHRVSIGVIASIVSGISILSTFFIVQILDQLGPRLVLVTILGWLFVIGLLVYMTIPVNNALVSEQADTATSGRFFGIMQTGAALGGAIGPAITGFVANTWGIAVAFSTIGFASFVLVGLFVAYSLVS